ncbi:hypothetical protein ACFFRR_003038 [Megaselia abdita]
MSESAKNKLDPVMKQQLQDLERNNQRLTLEVEELNQKTIKYDRILRQNREYMKEKELWKQQIMGAKMKCEKSDLIAEKYRRQLEEIKLKEVDRNLESKYNINEKLAEANLDLNKQVKELKTLIRESSKKHKIELQALANEVEQKDMNIRTLQYLNDELEKKFENSKKVIESNKEVSKELRKLTSRKAGSSQDNILTAFKCIALIRQKEENTLNLENVRESNSTELKLNDDKILESNLDLSKQVKDLMETTLRQKVEEKQNQAKIEDLKMNIRTLQYLNEELERKYENYKKIVDTNKDLVRELKKLTNKKGGSQDDFINSIEELHKLNEDLKASLLERFEDEDLVVEVKKFLNQSQLAFLQNPRSQIIEWKSEDVAEAVSLHALSSEAYTFLKNKGFPLPAESVLKKWSDQQFLSNCVDITHENPCPEEVYDQSPKKIKLEQNCLDVAPVNSCPEEGPKKIKLEPSSSDPPLKEQELLQIKQEMEDVDVESPFIPEGFVFTQEVKQEMEVHFELKEEIP